MSKATFSAARRGVLVLAVLGWASVWAHQTSAQYIGLGMPFNNNSDSYYERTGVGFNFWLNGSQTGRGVVGLMPNGQLTPDGRIYFSQGGFGSAIPPFGGYDPSANATLGFANIGGSGGFSLNLALGKGSTRTSSNVTPSIVVPNGVPGSVFSGQLSPFVTGITPVVSGMPASYYLPRQPSYSINPVHYKLWLLQQQQAAGENGSDTSDGLVLSGSASDESSSRTFSDPDSSASHAALSVEELKRQRDDAIEAEERQRASKIRELLVSADKAVQDRYYGAARERLKRALRLAMPNERQEIQDKLDAVPDRQ